MIGLFFLFTHPTKCTAHHKDQKHGMLQRRKGERTMIINFPAHKMRIKEEGKGEGKDDDLALRRPKIRFDFELFSSFARDAPSQLTQHRAQTPNRDDSELFFFFSSFLKLRYLDCLCFASRVMNSLLLCQFLGISRKRFCPPRL